jgi:HEAT repeat protein
MKIAAIGMMDSRYVYRIPKPLTEELLGKMIKDADIQVRSRAAHAIGYNVLGYKFPDDLIKLLKEDDLHIKKNAIYGMRGRDKTFLEPLKKLLYDKDQEIRLYAIFHMSEYPQEDIAKEYRKLLDDKDDAIRAAALSYLRDIDFVKFLDDPSAGVRLAAVSCLGRPRPDKDAAKHFMRMLKDDSMQVRALAADRLAELKAKDSAKAVAELLSDKEPFVRRHAVMGLEFVGGADQVEKLRDLLRDEDNQMREHAARILGIWKVTAAAEELVKLLSDPTADVRRESVHALGQIDVKKHAAAIAGRLGDSDARVRTAAAHALARSGEYRFCDRLKMMAEKDPSDNVRIACREAAATLAAVRD